MTTHQVVQIAQDVYAEEGGADRQDVKVELVVGEHTDVLDAVHVAVDLPLQVGHAPAPVDEEEPDAEENLQDGT